MEEKRKIRVNLDIDPRTDPNSPEFDPAVWMEAMAGFNDRMEAVKQRLADMIKEQGEIDHLVAMETLTKAMSSITSTILLRAMEANSEDVTEFIKETVERLTEIAKLNEDEDQAERQMSLFQEDEGSLKSPRDVAIEKGALMTIGGHVAAYSTNDLKNALNAYSIMRLPSDTDAATAFDENGKLNMLMVQPQTLENLFEIDSAFLMALLQAVSLSSETSDDTVTVYTPTLCRELGIDPREYSSKRNSTATLSELRFNALFNRIMPFDPYVARTPDGSYYRVCSFDKYEKDSETISLRTPYFFKLKRMTEARDNELKHSQFNRLLLGNIATEPNSAAVELANRILQGIVTRGARADYRTYKADPQKVKQTVTKTDASGKRTTTTTTYKEEPSEAEPKEKKVTWKAKFSTLIDDCPQAALQLQKAKTVQAYNSKLKQLFEAAYRIIAEKSDAPARYIDFTLPTMQRTVKGKKRECYDVPTKSTINRYMKITHRGLNPDFRA